MNIGRDDREDDQAWMVYMVDLKCRLLTFHGLTDAFS
jgi:hypothetical protein